MSVFRIPNDTQRSVIVGRTGSGKTQFGMWQLSHRDYDQKPWIIFDFKGDELINDIEGAKSLTLTDPIPEKPGIYVVQPVHGEENAVEDMMWKILEAQDIGIYIDEGYMVGKNNKGFRTVLTQGRSKHLPTITLSQRPVHMDVFVFSEADFFQVFQLNHKDDRKKIGDYIPHNIEARLPAYHSYFYDVANDAVMVCKPVPDRDAILDTFAAKLARIPKTL